MEELIVIDKLNIENINLEIMDKYWIKAKKMEKED